MALVKLEIDGKEIQTERTKTVLEAALEAGIYIPNLCHHPDLKPFGSCRLCLVEIRGRNGVYASCTEFAEEGMVVCTDSEYIKELRRVSLEMMLVDHPKDCSACMKYGNCPMQSLIQYIGPSERFRKFPPSIREDFSHPLFIRDDNRCIKCGNCVRACRELRGVDSMDYYRTDSGEIRIGIGDEEKIREVCRFCCACVEVCPTGALRDKPETAPNKEGTREEKMVPCRLACPAHTDVVRYLRYIREGRYDHAVAVIREKVPFPASLGYVCSHPCEKSCKRLFVNEAVSIRNLKRFAAEHDNGYWKEKSIQKPNTGKGICVIGAGPAGLTAAYYLRKQGHKVIVYEELPEPGGMLRYGIPEYRLPRKILEHEIQVIINSGVVIITGRRVTDIDALLNEGYDAALLAVGAHKGIRLPLPGNNLAGVLINIDFLRWARLDKPPAIGNRVVVLGGGNVAFDCARLARRLGAMDIHVACLEKREAMTASEEEIHQALEEGIQLHPASSFVRIEGTEKVEGMTLEDVLSFSFDGTGKAQVTVVENSTHTIPADTVIMAVGQWPEDTGVFGLDLVKGAYFVVGEDNSCSKIGIFAAGDAVTGTDSVVRAIAGGRTAAESIDRYLGGDGNISEILAPVEEPDAHIGNISGFGRQKRHCVNCEAIQKRITNMDAVEFTFAEDTALAESRRCLQCDLRTRMKHPRLWGEFTSKAGA
jgi:NADPH-dependent glutamate synthase beta subunit-like oxidoreductase/NAD-dependent dihydropyrimidine dehydrogenase PreA subunit